MRSTGWHTQKKIKSFGQRFTNVYTTSMQVQKNKKQKLNNGFCKTALQLKYRKEKIKMKLKYKVMGESEQIINNVKNVTIDECCLFADGEQKGRRAALEYIEVQE